MRDSREEVLEIGFAHALDESSRPPRPRRGGQARRDLNSRHRAPRTQPRAGEHRAGAGECIVDDDQRINAAKARENGGQAGKVEAAARADDEYRLSRLWGSRLACGDDGRARGPITGRRTRDLVRVRPRGPFAMHRIEEADTQALDLGARVRANVEP